MENKRGYQPPKVSFKANFKTMCEELNYQPKKSKLKRGSDINVINQERIIYSSRGKGTL